MFCKNCGKPIEDGAAFCAYCGAKTEDSIQPESAVAAENEMPEKETENVNNVPEETGQIKSENPSVKQNSLIQKRLEEQKAQEAAEVEIAPVVETCEVAEVKKGKKKIWIPVLISLAVLGIIAAVVLLLVFKPWGSNSDEIATEEASDVKDEVQNVPLLYVKNGDTRVFYMEGKDAVELENPETQITLSPDGKTAYYGIDYDGEDAWSGTFTLVYAQSDDIDNYTEIDDDVDMYELSEDGRVLTYYKDEEFYVSVDAKSEGKRLDTDEDVFLCYIAHDLKSLVYKTWSGDLFFKDLKSGDEEKIDDSVHVLVGQMKDGYLKSTDDFYYTTARNNLCHYKDGDIEIVVKDVNEIFMIGETLFYATQEDDSCTLYMLDKNDESEEIIDDVDDVNTGYQLVFDYEGSKFEYYTRNVDKCWFLTSKGELIELDVEEKFTGYGTLVSEDEKELYLIMGEDSTLYRYVIDDGEVVDEEEICDDVWDVHWFGDDSVIIWRDDSICIYNKELLELCAMNGRFMLCDDVVYALEDGELYTAKIGDSEREKVEDVHDDIREIEWACGNLYYIASWDEDEECGKLYKLGSDDVIDKNVDGFGTYVYDNGDDDEDEAKSEEEENKYIDYNLIDDEFLENIDSYYNN